MQGRIIAILVAAFVFITAFAVSTVSARGYGGSFYSSQQMLRSQQMMRQQRQMQQQRQQQQQMRRQQELRRQQQMQQQRAMRERQQRAMQQRQQQAKLQRQQMAERQRRIQQERLTKSKAGQKSKGQGQQFAKQQKVLDQRRSLAQQRKVKLREDRLRRLRDERLRKQKQDKKKSSERDTMTLVAMRSRLSSMPRVARAPAKTVSKFRTTKQLRQQRKQHKAQQRVTKQLEKGRKAAQARAIKARNLQKRLQLDKKTKQKNPQAKDTKDKADKNFRACKGGRCETRGCSFHGDTPVLTKAGLKSIKSLKAGEDLVWSRSEFTGESGWKPVVGLFSDHHDESVELTVRSKDGKRALIRTTDAHPFFVSARPHEPSEQNGLVVGQWLNAAELRSGDRLLSSDGQEVEVVEKTVQQESLLAYNITVDEFHTYFVNGDGGDASAWVHNDCGPEKGAENLSGKQQKILKASYRAADGTRVAKVGIGKRAVEYRFKQGKDGKWYQAGAASSLRGAQLKEHLRQTEKYGQGGTKELANGRIRYYGKMVPSNKPGEMIGRRTVREWDPKTGRKRTWHEAVDQKGKVRQVRPESGDGIKKHHTFDEKGNYKGTW